MRCGSCSGTGKVSCTSCGGRGYTSRLTINVELDMSPCAVCGGKGKIRCNFCGGSGEIRIPAGEHADARPTNSDTMEGMLNIMGTSSPIMLTRDPGEYPDILVGRWNTADGSGGYEINKEGDNYNVLEYGMLGQTGKGTATLFRRVIGGHLQQTVMLNIKNIQFGEYTARLQLSNEQAANESFCKIFQPLFDAYNNTDRPEAKAAAELVLRTVMNVLINKGNETNTLDLGLTTSDVTKMSFEELIRWLIKLGWLRPKDSKSRTKKAA